MDALYKKQCTRVEQLQRLKSNYSKDSESRRTIVYLEDKLEKLGDWWSSYTDTDNEMKDQHFDNNPTHSYWAERDTVKQLYTTFNQEIERKLEVATRETIPTGSPTKTNPSTTDYGSATNHSSANSSHSTTNNYVLEPEQAQRYKTQDVKMRLCYKLIADTNELLGNQGSQVQLQHKLQQLNARIAQIEQLHEDILVHANADEEERTTYFTNDYYSALVNESETLRCKLAKNVQTTNEQQKSDSEKSKIKLKRIEIPQFYGETLKWAAFYDLFTKLVHENDDLSDTVKMHQLKTTVQGSAARIISHLEATGVNYQDAWKLLVNRYQNKRQLATTHINHILNFPSMHAESATTMKSLHDTLTESMHAIKNLGVITISWNYIVIPIVIKKLDNESLRLYEMTIPDPREMPTIEEFLAFLERRFQALEAARPKSLIFRNSGPTQQPGTTPQLPRLKNLHVKAQRTCINCKQLHELQDCLKFQQMSTLERSRLINQHNLCKICLEKFHQPCLKSTRCLVCKGAHHTLLHSNNHPQRTMLTKRVDDNPKKEADETCMVTNHFVNQFEQPSGTLLATAMVEVQDGKQQPTLLRMLIDPGSQISFITNEASKKIKQPAIKTHVEISGLNDSDITTATKLVTFRIGARFSSNFSMEMEALVLPNITRPLPEQHFDNQRWEHLNNLLWADPTYNQPNKIDILLGADYYPNILMNQVVKGNQGEPVAQQTELGWIIFGNMVNEKSPSVQSMVTLVDIENQLKRFWEVEEISPKNFMTEEERMCEEHYQQNYCRTSDGRYMVRIPFQQNITSIGSSKKRALARFIQIERRLSVVNEFSNRYRECIEGYFNQGHLIGSNVQTQNEYYIPHHAVVKTTSTTTKLRVVFDASAKTDKNISLNETQLVGPKLQEDLMSILIRWRKYKVAYTADIEQMYRQIKVHPDDQQYQKILWRKTPGEVIKSYQLTTVTFGMSSAPYLAIKTLQQLATDEKVKFPIAANIIMSDFYVDDVLSGSNTLEEAQNAQNQLISALKTGGFNLRKWASNYHQLVEAVGSESRALEPIIINDDAVKTLGLLWNPTTDTFEFKVNLNEKGGIMTKRKMLSESSKVFDPLGWLSPTLIQAKILMQTLWISGVTWDEKLPEDVENKCRQYYVSLPKLEEIKIPRWINFNSTLPGELHGFCDASEVAYAAVIYFYDRSLNKATLLTSKTRVAPIATKLTLPRLELCGASLLANLMSKVQQDMKFDKTPTYFWTDSMIVLGWVKNKPHKFKTFVANRISGIQKLTASSQWLYVKSSDNPADCASRGIEANQLIRHNLWWNGPQHVFTTAIQLTPMEPEGTPDQLELKQPIVGATTVTSNNPIENLYRRHSNFNTIKRILVYVLRFIDKGRRNTVNNQEVPTAAELKNATQVLIKLAQRQRFRNEIYDLTNQKGVANKSKIKSLSPFIQDDILRVGGRVQNITSWSYDEKHPIIVPRDHPITKLLIEEAHKQTMHGGTQLTLAHLRTRYWIIHGRNLTRHFISKCTRCHRFNTKTGTQQMGNLPAARITPGRPFLRTGVDYAGPLLIRTTKGRGHKAHKGYLAIFVCMTTKAIHIEPVSDLTTEAFIAAYKRFTARRGLCSDLYSDNGTNFVGANNQLDRELAALIRNSNKEITQLLANDETTWHFIPPASPHFGGLWEAAVKSVKRCLIKVIGEATLTFEELSTVTSQIEACLNSRPLAPLSTDPTDVTFLTPGHFLIGAPLKAIPQDTIAETTNCITRWKLVEKIKQDFWRRWHSEYLNQFQHRRKWSDEQPNMKIGDLVLIKEDKIPPLKWLTGRVMEVHPGIDQKVRVVSLRGPGGILIKRPIHKLSRLPIEHENETNQTNTHSPVEQPQQPTIPLRVQPPREVKKKRQVYHNKVIFKKGATMRLIILMLGIMQGLFSLGTSESIVEPLPTDAGIYFHNTGTVNLMAMRWKIIVNYNLSGYWDDISSIEYYISHLNNTCQTGWTGGKRPKLCDVVVHQLTEQMQEITSQNALLMSTNKDHALRKRDIGDTIGYILGDAFGIMNQRDASHIENQLEKAEDNEKYLLALIQNQTSIIDSTINVFQHDRETTANHFKIISQQFLYLDGKIQQLSIDGDRYDRVQSITTYTIQIIMIMRRIAGKQRVIIDVIINAHQGHIHPALLAPQQLKEEINRIKDYISPTMMIPEGDDDNSLGHIYNLLTVQTRVTNNHILFLIQMPLAYSETYQLFHIVPIPKTENGQLHIIMRTTEYLIVNMHRERFAPLTNDELQQCVLIKNNGYLCTISPIYNIQSNQSQCEMNLLRHVTQNLHGCTTTILHQPNYWMPLDTNKWLFSVTAPKIVDLICDRQITTMKLQNSGILSLDRKCTLKNGHFYLTTIDEKSYVINSSFAASIKIQSELKNSSYLSELPTIPSEGRTNNSADFSLNKDIINLETAIAQQKLKETALPKSMDSSDVGHHIHHYVMTYTMVIIGVVIMLLYLCRRKTNYRVSSEEMSPPQRPTPRPRSLNCGAPQYVQSRV